MQRRGYRTSLESSGDSLTTLLEGLALTSLLHAQDTASLTLIEVHYSLRHAAECIKALSIWSKAVCKNIIWRLRTQTTQRQIDAREWDKNWWPTIAWLQRRGARLLRSRDSFSKYLTSLLYKLKHCQFSYVLKIGCTFLSVNFDALRFWTPSQIVRN